MLSSLDRIFTIGRITLLEAIRQQILTVLLIVALAMVSCAALFGGFVVDEQIKFIKDFCTGIMSVFGLAIAVLSTAMLIPQELQNRTIYTILAKPVRRSEFLLGKFLGVFLLITFSMLLMSLVFAAALYAQEIRSMNDVENYYDSREKNWQKDPDTYGAYQKDLSALFVQSTDPHIISVLLLIYAKLVMVAALALFFSTFASSYLFTVVVTGMVYLIGSLESVARSVWLSGHDQNPVAGFFLGIVTLLVPDFNSYTIIDEVLAGNVVPFSHVENLLAYSVVYLAVLLTASNMIFQNREI